MTWKTRSILGLGFLMTNDTQRQLDMDMNHCQNVYSCLSFLAKEDGKFEWLQ
jgi:hypothetical protein